MKKNGFRMGVLCTVISSLGFALMTLCVRQSGALPSMQKAFFRNFIAMIIAGVSILRMHGTFLPKKENVPSLLARCISGALGLFANFWAIDHLMLADANLLNKTSPFFAILLSIPILKEKPSVSDHILTGIALLGTLFVIKPTRGLAGFPALVGLFGGACAGCAYTYVRKMSLKQENSKVIVFWFSFFSSVCALPFLALNFVPMTVEQVLWLLGAGACAAVGQFGVTSAYKYAPAKDVSVFNYTQVLFSAAIGFLFLSELPDVYSWIGYTIIITAALVKWRIAMVQK